MEQRFNWPMGGGGKPPAKPNKMSAKGPSGRSQDPQVSEKNDDGLDGDPTPAIHAHLQDIHDQTGEAHSHVEHHDDGTHTSHHIDKAGQISGPHDHANLEDLKNSFNQFANEEEHEGDEGGY